MLTVDYGGLAVHYLYTIYPIVARTWPSARASKGILRTS